MVKITSDMSPQVALSKIRGEFNLKYKYKILGKTDLLYQSIAPIIQDKTDQAGLKSRRTRMAAEIAALETSEPDENTRKRLTAEKQLAFAEYALRLVKKVEKTGGAQGVATALQNITTSIKNSISLYVEGRGGSENIDTANNTADQSFMEKAQTLNDGIEKMMKRSKNRLLDEKVFFSTTLNAAKKDLNAANESLDIYI
jgi:hypothetical protein